MLKAIQMVICIIFVRSSFPRWSDQSASASWLFPSIFGSGNVDDYNHNVGNIHPSVLPLPGPGRFLCFAHCCGRSSCAGDPPELWWTIPITLESEVVNVLQIGKLAISCENNWNLLNNYLQQAISIVRFFLSQMIP